MLTGELGTSAFGLTSVGSSDAVVGNRTSSGQASWVKSFVNAGDNVSGIALSASGEVIVIGNVIGTVNLGTGALPPPGSVFVAKLAP